MCALSVCVLHIFPSWLSLFSPQVNCVLSIDSWNVIRRTGTVSAFENESIKSKQNYSTECEPDLCTVILEYLEEKVIYSSSGSSTGLFKHCISTWLPFKGEHVTEETYQLLFLLKIYFLIHILRKLTILHHLALILHTVFMEKNRNKEENELEEIKKF